MDRQIGDWNWTEKIIFASDAAQCWREDHTFSGDTSNQWVIDTPFFQEPFTRLGEIVPHQSVCLLGSWGGRVSRTMKHRILQDLVSPVSPWRNQCAQSSYETVFPWLQPSWTCERFSCPCLESDGSPGLHWCLGQLHLDVPICPSKASFSLLPTFLSCVFSSATQQCKSETWACPHHSHHPHPGNPRTSWVYFMAFLGKPVTTAPVLTPHYPTPWFLLQAPSQAGSPPTCTFLMRYTLRKKVNWKTAVLFCFVSPVIILLAVMWKYYYYSEIVEYVLWDKANL